MTFWLLRRLLRAIVTLWIVVTLTFFMMRMAGDPAEALVPPDAGPEVIEYYREKWGFDQPLSVQYGRYFSALMQGEAGVSLHTGRSVSRIVVEKIPKTLMLGGTALAIAMVLGILIGIVAALNRNSSLDRIVMAFSVFAFAMPNFFFGLLLILGAALLFRVFVGASNGGILALLMPAATLGLAQLGSIARFTRSAMLETLNKPFMMAAVAKGVPFGRRILRHALPNAAIPIVTLLGLSLGGLIAGSIVTERVFGWPGVGSLLIRSVETRDLATVQFIVLLVAATMTIANLVVDLLYLLIDPRIRVK